MIEEGEDLALGMRLAFFETSAATGLNCDEVFPACADQVKASLKEQGVKWPFQRATRVGRPYTTDKGQLVVEAASADGHPTDWHMSSQAGSKLSPSRQEHWLKVSLLPSLF